MRRTRSAVATAALLAILVLAGPGGCAHRDKRPPKDEFAGMSARQIHDAGIRRLRKKSYTRARDTLQSALGRQDATPDLIASVHLALADAYFYDGGLLNLAEALSRYTNFLTFYPNHERADYAQYQLGLCYLKQALSPDRDQGQTKKALAELLKVERTYPNSSYVAAADDRASQAKEKLAEHDFRIGSFYFKGGAYKGAVDRLRDLLESYPGYSRKDRVYLLLGQSLMALKKDDEGRIYLQKLVAEFPKSRHASAARALLAQPIQTAESTP